MEIPTNDGARGVLEEVEFLTQALRHPCPQALVQRQQAWQTCRLLIVQLQGVADIEPELPPQYYHSLVTVIGVAVSHVHRHHPLPLLPVVVVVPPVYQQ